MVKNLPAIRVTWVRSLDWEDPLDEDMATHYSILAGESHRERNLAGYCPWGSKESDRYEMNDRQIRTSSISKKYAQK